jgi:hypothetical protein
VRLEHPDRRAAGLHAEILQALLDAAADPADIVHHAEARRARTR